MSWCCFSSFLQEEEYKPESQESIGFSLDHNVKSFTSSQLAQATNNFHPSNRIGRGGFGAVYKGILKDGSKIAVKELSIWSKQGDKEFTNEIKAIANVKHPNLVHLIGYCSENNTRMLVYELMEKGSLDHALLGEDPESTLDWIRRKGICIGTAKGLQYLHEEVVPHIVHRDIKASNILLDMDFIPKIGDFGLAKLFPDNVTHLSTRVAGTTGYLAPEYLMGGKLTKKADVYSFGVLVLEVVTGQSSSRQVMSGTENFLLEETWRLHEEGKLMELVDPNLKEYPDDEVLKFMKVALFCMQGAANRRPNMTQVVEMLSKNIRLEDKELMRPGLIGDMLKLKASQNAQNINGPDKNPLSNDDSGSSLSCSDVNPR